LKNENISLLSVSKGTEKCHIKFQQFLNLNSNSKITKIKIMVSSSKSGDQLKKLNGIFWLIMISSAAQLFVLFSIVGFWTRLYFPTIFCRKSSNFAKATLKFHWKFILNVWLVGCRLKIVPFWAQNASLLNLIYFFRPKSPSFAQNSV
jgi:hypothetical protein